jgi:cytochrome c556
MTMMPIRRGGGFLLGASLLVFTALPTQASEDPIADRQAMMENVGAAIGAISKMIKGETEFDAALANMSIRTMYNASVGFPYLFPEGSETGGETEASPKIWEDMDGFTEKAVDMQDVTALAIAAPATSLDDLRAQLGEIGQTCKACHEGFRVKKD